MTKRMTERPPVAAQDLVVIDDGNKFVWVCERCFQRQRFAGRELIGWGEGYVTIEYPKADRSRTYTWEVLHRYCDPNIDRYDYTIDVERLTTVDDLIDWDSHLRHKQCIHQTNWWMVRGSAEIALDEAGAFDEVARNRSGQRNPGAPYA